MSKVKLTPKADFVLDTLSPGEKSETVRLFEAMKAQTLQKLNFKPVPGSSSLLMKRMKDEIMLLCTQRDGKNVEVVDIFRTPARLQRPARKKKR